MGSGIAQKMATEGFAVTLVDLDDEKVGRGMSVIEKDSDRWRAARHLRRARVAAILGRIPAPHASRTSPRWTWSSKRCSRTSTIKKDVFARLDEVCRPDTILATNTSSYAVTDLAAATTRPERVVGLHYFFHPAKNRLVEVVAGTGHQSHRLSARLAPSGSAGQDADRLERLLRLHRQPLLPALADRSRAHRSKRAARTRRRSTKPRSRRSASAWDRSS